MGKKVTGVILIIIGLLPFILPIIRGFLVGGNGRAGHAADTAGPAQHLGPLTERLGDFSQFLIVVPIILVITGVILLTHKEKAVKKIL